MKLRRLIKNQLMTLLTQEQPTKNFLKTKFTAIAAEPQLPRKRARHLARWHMPEQGFRNYWYPVMMASDLADRPVKRRRLLGEDIAFWRDGGKVNAIADRCPHRGASMSAGHIRFPGSGTAELPVSWLDFRRPWPTPRLHSRRTEFAHGREGQDEILSCRGTVTAWSGLGSAIWSRYRLKKTFRMAMKVPGVTSLVHFTKRVDDQLGFSFRQFYRRSARALPASALAAVFAAPPPVPGRRRPAAIFNSSNMTVRSSKRPMCAPRTPTGWSSRWSFPVWENFRSIIGGASVRLRPNRKPTLCPAWLAGFISPCAAVLRAYRAQDPVLHPIHHPHRPLPSLQHVRHHRKS